MSWDTRIARRRGTVSDVGSKEGERYSISLSEGEAMVGFKICDCSEKPSGGFTM
jgi:hypothetical protein